MKAEFYRPRDAILKPDQEHDHNGQFPEEEAPKVSPSTIRIAFVPRKFRPQVQSQNRRYPGVGAMDE